MYAVFEPTAAIHVCTASAMNSGPLSDRICPGTPRSMNSSLRTSITSIDFSLRRTLIAKLSCVNSSTTLSIRYFLPSWLRAQTETRPVGEPQTAAFWLFRWNLQPLTPPDALDPLIIDQPARMAQQRRDLAIGVAAVLTSKLDDISGQTLFIISPRWRLALRRA